MTIYQPATPTEGPLKGASMTQLVTLTLSALAKLGPGRVEQGAAALSDARKYPGWNGCFLACAYGERGALHRRLDVTLPGNWGLGSWQIAARELGLTDDEAYAIVWLYDIHRPVLAELVDQYQQDYRERAALPARRTAELLLGASA